MAIPLTLIGGYLGSGKTTLINRLLSSEDAGRTAVVVNDFGDVNIDAALIAASGADTVELTNGCICCQITDDVRRTMSALASRDDIDHAVCEVSGIGDPSQLGTWRTFPGFCPGPVVVCADAAVTPRRLADEYVADVVHRQIATADLLLVTRADLASAGQIEATREACGRIAPTAQVHTIADGDPAPLLALLRRPSGDDSQSAQTDSSPQDPVSHADVHRTATVRLGPAVEIDAVARLLERNTTGLVRAKGFAPDSDGRWKQIQLAGGAVSIAPLPTGAEAPSHPEVVLIALGPRADETLKAVADRLRALPSIGDSPVAYS